MSDEEIGTMGIDKSSAQTRYKDLVVDHITRVNKLIASLETQSEQPIEFYFVRVRLSLVALNSLLEPVKDEKYDQPEDIFDIDVGKRNKSPAQKTKEIMELIQEHYTQLIQLARRQNIL